MKVLKGEALRVVFLNLAVLAFVGGLMAKTPRRVKGIEVEPLRDSNFHPSDYSGAIFRGLNDDAFLRSIADRNNAGSVGERVRTLDEALAAELNGTLRPGEEGWSGSRPLYFSVTLLNLISGRRGFVRYAFEFWDRNSKEVALIDVTAVARTGYITDPTGTRHRNLLPEQIVSVVNAFLGSLP